MLILCQFAFGQSWNPDADGNNLINYNDLLQFLPLYGNAFFPEEFAPVIQYCYFTDSDCSVSDSTDIVILTGSSDDIYDPSIFLPDGVGLKTVLVMQEGNYEGTSVNIRGRCTPSISDCQLFQNLNYYDLGLFMRTPSGLWRLLQDQY